MEYFFQPSNEVHTAFVDGTPENIDTEGTAVHTKGHVLYDSIYMNCPE